MHDQVGSTVGLVREIEALGQRWHDWHCGERRRLLAVELLGGPTDPRQAPAIPVEREDFNVAGEIMVCLHAGCAGFVRGLIRRGGYVYWVPFCECPGCGQRYVIEDG